MVEDAAVNTDPTPGNKWLNQPQQEWMATKPRPKEPAPEYHPDPGRDKTGEVEMPGGVGGGDASAIAEEIEEARQKEAAEYTPPDYWAPKDGAEFKTI